MIYYPLNGRMFTKISPGSIYNSTSIKYVTYLVKSTTPNQLNSAYTRLR